MVFHGDLVVASEAFGDSMLQNDIFPCITDTSGAQMSFLHKEYVYFQHVRVQNFILAQGICIFSARESAKFHSCIRNMYILST